MDHLTMESVKLNFFPPVNDIRILVIACPILGILVLAPTAIPINGAVALMSGFKNLFQAVCVPLKKTLWFFTFY